MLERFRYFSISCAIVLASACLGSLVQSWKESKDGRVHVHRVVLGELPAMLYLWSLTLFLLQSMGRGFTTIASVVFSVTIPATLYRLATYARKRKIFERREILGSLRQVTQNIEQIQLQVMSQGERAKYLKVQPEPPAAQRVSRYKRSPVI